MKIEFSSQRREMFLFLTINMAAVTSCANQQFAFNEAERILILHAQEFVNLCEMS